MHIIVMPRLFASGDPDSTMSQVCDDAPAGLSSLPPRHPHAEEAVHLMLSNAEKCLQGNLR